MKKNVFKFATLVVTLVAMAVAFTGCSKDDANDSASSDKDFQCYATVSATGDKGIAESIATNLVGFFTGKVGTLATVTKDGSTTIKFSSKESKKDNLKEVLSAISYEDFVTVVNASGNAKTVYIDMNIDDETVIAFSYPKTPTGNVPSDFPGTWGNDSIKCQIVIGQQIEKDGNFDATLKYGDEEYHGQLSQGMYNLTFFSDKKTEKGASYAKLKMAFDNGTEQCNCELLLNGEYVFEDVVFKKQK